MLAHILLGLLSLVISTSLVLHFALLQWRNGLNTDENGKYYSTYVRGWWANNLLFLVWMHIVILLLSIILNIFI